MLRFEIDTNQVSVMSAAISVLGQNFDTTIQLPPDNGGSCGPGIQELELIRVNLEKAKESIAVLLDATVRYLNTTTASFDKADAAEAAELLYGSDLIDERTWKQYHPYRVER